MSKGMSIFLIIVGIIVALSGIVVIAVMDNWIVGLILLVVGLVFSYMIYKKNEETIKAPKEASQKN